MDEAWERAVEAALQGQGDGSAGPRSLTLDGAVKCLQGRLPAAAVSLERFRSLEHLSLASIGVSTLDNFPRLPGLQRLILSDNRIAGGLERLVEAGLESLRDLDLSNNRIQSIEDLAPLARFRLVSLDLYECPVTRVKDYRSRVFSMIRSLKYLDKLDADDNERPETDDEEEEDDEEDDEEDEEEDEDPGSGEVDGEERVEKGVNGFVRSRGGDGVVDVDEDEESDADEEETDASGVGANGSAQGSHGRLSNGFRVAVAGADQREEEDDEDVEDEDDDDLVEDVDEDEGDEEEEDDVPGEGPQVEEDSEEEDGVEDVDGDEEEYDDEEDPEEEADDEEPASNGRITSTEGEIDGHEAGEEGEDDDNGELGEEDEDALDEERDYEDDDVEEEDDGFMLRPIRQPDDVQALDEDVDAGNDDNSEEEEVDDDNEDDHRTSSHPSTSRDNKRRRDNTDDGAGDGDDDVDDDGIEDLRASKHRFMEGNEVVVVVLWRC